ncbi:hypothetical protein BDW22DRAFT_1320092 [Trametopsis cervina]|nr:hypothetical protein BDW22DRAFT_1320092 [Trametopsis cervina]
MSLRHILNEEPTDPLPPPSHPAPPPATISTADSAAIRQPSPPPIPEPASSRRRKPRTRDASSPPPQDSAQPTSRPFTYQPAPYPAAGAWEPQATSWVQNETFTLAPGGQYYSQPGLRPNHRNGMSNGESNGLSAKEGVLETNGRKKRRTATQIEEEQDRQPATRRRNPRRNPPRGKTDARVPDISTLSQAVELEIPVEEFLHREPTDEERRLASSDLDDCPEIWQGELGSYVLDTHKRQRQIDAYFNRWVINRDATTAYQVSHLYVNRIARIPLPASPQPPPPPPISPSVENDSGRAISPSVQSDGFDVDYSYSRGAHGSAADAARELEDNLLGTRGKSTRKRPTGDDASDDSSETEVPISMRQGPATKKRKLAKAPGPDGVHEVDVSYENGPGVPLGVKTLVASAKGKGKGKQREQSVDSGSATPKGRRRGLKKKLDGLPPQAQDIIALGSASAPLSRDGSPLGSRAPSPALTNISTTFFELDEAIPSLRKAKRVDEAGMWKRVKSLEEAQRKVWTNIARRDVVKVYRYHSGGYQSRQAQLKRIATMSSLQARRPFVRTAKSTKDVQAKGKRLMREMLVFWKKNEKEERDVRRREHKEAIDRAKVEEEKREAARQARKLEFLISQTELYSHFVGNKLKTAEVQGDEAESAPAGANVEDLPPHEALQEIDFDDDDPTNIHRHARRNAQEAIALARRRAQDFDVQAALDRKTNEALKLAKGQAHIRDDEDTGEQPSGTPLVDLDSDELNFQNPTSLTGELTIKQPNMLMATLKEYQLKGLNWLATLYEQGINGILADEMGLGKTVQSISLLAYLAEKHDIWGPFLVVSPASTLHNWQQEITRFVPKLKALPYWGNVKDRATLRKFWSKKEISYNEDAPFHILITSYQLITQDQQYFQRVKWQYMILDEAQNIKNSSSARWKTLLGFHCRNRLLLTGTPIQNNMQELWALLHFIMPSLFDSHDEFNEWFSKDIENAAENKGSRLNEHQLRRLHMILKPFMLRRVKRHVQNELSDKIEKDIYVDLSARQRKLYKALLANVSVADLLEKAANMSDADSARSLMNLVMQFRKVCNHPELFERADVVAPFSFSLFGKPGPISREGDFVQLPYSTRNPIEYEIPSLLYNDGGLLDVPRDGSPLQADRGPMATLLNIWSTDWMQRSLEQFLFAANSSFAFLRFMEMSPSEAHKVHISPMMQRQLTALEHEHDLATDLSYKSDNFFIAGVRMSAYVILRPSLRTFEKAEGLPYLEAISSSAWTSSCLSRTAFHWYIPPVVAPPIAMYCTNRTFLERQSGVLDAPTESAALYGVPPQLREFEDVCTMFKQQIPGVPVAGLIHSSPGDQLPTPPMHVPEAKRLIYDSAKLARLDSLLHELKAGDHKVLVYFQMTRMMDLMEEYLIYRQYKYLRLDGSSKLEDRRDMVMEWQTRPDIFVFLLSTRAGGLGINLTAADTVVFYDHDWNPSNDAQAMDRAHRLGQTRQVTVYRLITKGTIDERIVQLARVKKDVQDIVVGNKNFTDVTKPSEIVQLLLNEDQLANLESNNTNSAKKNGKKPAALHDTGDAVARDLWNEEGDEFFGHSGAANSGGASIQELDDEGTPVPSTRKKGRGEGTGARRGRKPGPKPGRKRGGAPAVVDGDL